MTEGKIIEADLTYQIRACAFTVSNELGPGFLERVYENALAIELRDAGLEVKTQCPIEVRYKRQIVGEYIADGKIRTDSRSRYLRSSARQGR